MDAIKILKRAWQILWSYRALWALGFILALTVAGSSAPNNNQSRYSFDSNDAKNPTGIQAPIDEQIAQAFKELQNIVDEGLPSLDITAQEINILLWIGVILIFLALITGLLMTMARYVAETAVIRMVDEHEKTGAKPGVRQGLRFGWSRSALRLFLISLLINLPVLFLGLLIIVLAIGVIVLLIQGNTTLMAISIVGGIGLAFLLIFMLLILGLLLSILERFIWRACILEQLGVKEAFRQGFRLVKQNWKSVGLMWLIMFGVRILWTVGFFLCAILLIPVMIITALAGLVVGGVPTLLVAGISSLFLNGTLPWIIGAIFGLPLFLVVTVVPLVFLRGLELVYNSTVWTLTYRELNTLPLSEPSTERSKTE